MTERKPPGVAWETWVDTQIRIARERGEFDNLPGTGKPIADLNRPDDEMWWVKSFLKREGVSFLPETLQLRKDVEDALALVDAAGSEAEVREIAVNINARIREVNRKPADGPPSNVAPLDEDDLVLRWEARRTP